MGAPARLAASRSGAIGSTSHSLPGSAAGSRQHQIQQRPKSANRGSTKDESCGPRDHPKNPQIHSRRHNAFHLRAQHQGNHSRRQSHSARAGPLGRREGRVAGQGGSRCRGRKRNQQAHHRAVEVVPITFKFSNRTQSKRRNAMSENKKVAVFGIYSTRTGVENAASALASGGFPVADISVLLPESLGAKDMGTEKATKAPEGAAAGVTTGGMIGGALGVLAGVGLLAIPGLGPFIAAGPIMAGLAGLGVGGAVGGVTGALIGMGIPEFEAKRYEGRLQKGGILLSVHCDTSDEINRAKEVLKATGAEDIASTGESSVDAKQTDHDAAAKAARRSY